MKPPRPTLEVLPEGGVYSDSKLACDLLAEYYAEPLEWQKDLLKKLLMEDESAQYLAPRIGFSAPRRQGKTIAVLALILHALLVEEKHVAYTAHLSKSSKELWKILRPIFEESDLAPDVKRISGERGHETIELHSGASFQLFTRQEGSGSGRGSKADTLILDEAYDLPQGTLGDLIPMVRNSSKPLVIMMGSPSYETSANGTAFRNFRQKVLDGSAPMNGWIEYGAPADADIHDRDVWRATNPAMFEGIITERQLESDILSGDVSDEQAKVEYLGSWHALSRPCIVDISKYESLGGHEFYPAEDSELVVAVDSDPDGRITSLVVAGYTEDDIPVVEVVQHGPGNAWVPGAIRRLFEAQPNITSFLIDNQNVLKHYVEELESEGIPITLTSTEFMSLAAPAFVQNYATGQFRHRSNISLKTSILGAENRKLMGRNVWKKAEPEADITTLVASALALYGLNSEKALPAKRKKPRTNTVTIGGKTYTR